MSNVRKILDTTIVRNLRNNTMAYVRYQGPILATLLGFAGCTALEPQSGHEFENINIVDFGALTLLGSSSRVIVNNRNGSFCIGPPPDAAFTDSFSEALKISLVEANEESSESITEGHNRSGLGGRNPNVLITRDILFETCLLMEKAKLNPSQMIELYERTLDAIIKINAAPLDGNSIQSDNPMLTAAEN